MLADELGSVDEQAIHDAKILSVIELVNKWSDNANVHAGSFQLIE